VYTDLDELWAALAGSEFRSRFTLRGPQRTYLTECGAERIAAQARRFVRERLAPAEPVNDGKQTPMRNHPVFVAQHATATCCRGCLAKWHGVAKGAPLTDGEVDYLVDVIMQWLRRQAPDAPRGPKQSLFEDTER